MSPSRPALRLATPAAASVPAPPAADPLLGAFATVVDRLEAVVAGETQALEHRLPVDVAASNRHKRQGLLELSRLMRAMPPGGVPEAGRTRLAALVVALERNQAALDSQIRAVRGVADIVARVMREAESDGTYTLRTRWQ